MIRLANTRRKVDWKNEEVKQISANAMRPWGASRCRLCCKKTERELKWYAQSNAKIASYGGKLEDGARGCLGFVPSVVGL